MNALSWIVETPFSTRFTITLFHFLWQGCFGGLLVIAGAQLLKGASARIRYAINVTVLLVMTGCLPVTFWLLNSQNLVETNPPRAMHAARPPEITMSPEESGSISEVDEQTTFIALDQVRHVEEGVSSSSQPRTTPSTIDILRVPVVSSYFPLVSQWITALYFCGVILISGRLTWGLLGGSRLRRISTVADDEALLQTVHRLAVRVRLKVTPSIAWCEQITIPVVVGIVRPMILLPAAIMSGLTPNQVETLLLHELAHIRRFDPMVNLTQRIIETFLFFHPAVWYISHRISVEREYATDDVVLVAGCARPIYADALVRVAELSLAIHHGQIVRRAMVLGISGTSSKEFKLRVLRLLDETQPPALKLSRSTFLITLLATALGIGFAFVLAGRFGATSHENEAAVAVHQNDTPVDQKADDAAAAPADKPAADVLPPPQWGEVKNGLRLRVVPVLSSMDENKIDPSKQVTTFASPADLAYVVEIENVGDQPKSLVDRREREGNDKQEKRRSDWLNQFLFSIDLYDPDGKLIERPEVQVLDVDLVLDGERIAELAPRAKRLYLLRPDTWLSGLKYRIEPGRYSAVVHYHGMPKETVNRADGYKRPIPQELIAAAVGDIVSPRIPIEVNAPAPGLGSSQNRENDESQDNSNAPKLVWSEPLRGLRTAMEFVPSKASYAHGEEIKTKIHLWNVSDGPIRFQVDLTRSDPKVTIKDHHGEPVDFGDRNDGRGGMGMDAQATLKPDQVLIIDACSVGFESSKNRAEKFDFWLTKVILAPGDYTMQLHAGIYNSWPIKDAHGKIIPLTDRDWSGPIVTGPTPFEVTSRPKSQDDGYEGLESLRPYPKMHDFSLEMTEHEILEIAKRERLEFRKIPEDDGARYELPTDDQQIVIVEFDGDGKCQDIRLTEKIPVAESPKPERFIRAPRFNLPDRLNVKAVRMKPDRNELVSVALEKTVTVRTWDLIDQRLKSEIALDTKLHGTLFLYEPLMLSEDCQHVMGVRTDGVAIWETTSGKFVKLLGLPENLSRFEICSLDCTPDASRVVAGTKPGSGGTSAETYAIVWDVASGQVVSTIKHDNATKILCVSLSSDGKRLATGDEKGATTTWDIDMERRVLSISDHSRDIDHPDPNISRAAVRQVTACQFSPDGRYLAFGDLLGLKVLDTNIGAVMLQMSAPYRLGLPGFVFSNNGKWLARVGTDKTVPIWSVETGELFVELPIEAHAGAFSTDGKSFVTGSTNREKSIVVWQLAEGSDPQSRIIKPARTVEAEGKNEDTIKQASGDASYPQRIHIVLRDTANEDHKFETDAEIQRRGAVIIPESFKLPFANVKRIQLRKQPLEVSVKVDFEILDGPDPAARFLVDLTLLDASNATIHHTWQITSDVRTQEPPGKAGDAGLLKIMPDEWSSATLRVRNYELTQAKTLEISLRALKSDELNHFPDQPSKTNMTITRPDAEGRFTVSFDNPIDRKKPGRWSLDPQKDEVVFQIFIKDAESKLQNKIFMQLPAHPTGGYRVNVKVPPQFFDKSVVSATFVTIQPDHEKWVDDFFHKGKGTTYKGLWSGDGGPLQRTTLDNKHVGWLPE